MNRITRQLARGVNDARADKLRGLFMNHCERFRAAHNMPEAAYPTIPETVSSVSSWNRERLDATPYEVLDAEAEAATLRGDWPTCDVLGMELERRQEDGATNPDLVATEEHDRWKAWASTADPATHPEVRRIDTTSPRDLEKVRRVEYEMWVEGQMARAARDTRGVLMTHKGYEAAARKATITERALWTNHVTAKAYASEELRLWWSQPGNERLTFDAWKERATTGSGEASYRVSKSELLSV